MKSQTRSSRNYKTVPNTFSNKHKLIFSHSKNRDLQRKHKLIKFLKQINIVLLSFVSISKYLFLCFHIFLKEKDNTTMSSDVS